MHLEQHYEHSVVLLVASFEVQVVGSLNSRSFLDHQRVIIGIRRKEIKLMMSWKVLWKSAIPANNTIKRCMPLPRLRAPPTPAGGGGSRRGNARFMKAVRNDIPTSQHGAWTWV